MDGDTNSACESERYAYLVPPGYAEFLKKEPHLRTSFVDHPAKITGRHTAISITNRLSISKSRFDERSCEFTQARYQVWRAFQFFDFANDGASDNGGVCKTPDPLNLLRR